jgi:hypothetical protein
VIALTSPNGVKGELFITKLNSTIPLSINGMIRERIRVNETQVRNYTFYSITAFNVSVNVVYGSVWVTIVDPDGKVVSSKIVNDSMQFSVKKSNSS